MKYGPVAQHPLNAQTMRLMKMAQADGQHSARGYSMKHDVRSSCGDHSMRSSCGDHSMKSETKRGPGRPPKEKRQYTKSGKPNMYMEAMHHARKNNLDSFTYNGTEYYRDVTDNGLVVYKK